MAKKKALSKYNPQFEELLRKAANGTVKLTLGNSTEAETLRSEIYAYRSVVHKEATIEDFPDLEAYRLLIQSVRLIRKGKVLHVSPCHKPLSF